MAPVWSRAVEMPHQLWARAGYSAHVADSTSTIAGAVGGVIGFLIIVAVIIYLVRRSHKKKRARQARAQV
ncbi:hypothetical protein MMC30_009371 [Trapelia coarctata]|nr:hypothetical protein [Trapelia coarctata]